MRSMLDEEERLERPILERAFPGTRVEEKRRESFVALDAHRLLGYCYVISVDNAGRGKGVDGGSRAFRAPPYL